MNYPILDVYLTPGRLSVIAGADELTDLMLLQIGKGVLSGRLLDLYAKPSVSVVVVDSNGGQAAHNALARMDCDIPVCTIGDPQPLQSHEPGRRGTCHPSQLHPDDVISAASRLWDPSAAQKLVLLTGLDNFYRDNPNSYKPSQSVVRDFNQAAADANCAILVSAILTNDVKRFRSAPRTRVYGCAAWTSGVDDVFILDFPTENFSTDQRHLFLTKRNYETRRYSLIHDKLGEFTHPTGTTEDRIYNKLLGLLCTKIPPGDPHRKKDLRFLLNPEFAVGERSWDEWFSNATDAGYLEKLAYGVYAYTGLRLKGAPITGLADSPPDAPATVIH